MTETMFARAAAPKPDLGLGAILVTLALVAGGFLLSTSTLPQPPSEPPSATAPAEPAPSAPVTKQS